MQAKYLAASEWVVICDALYLNAESLSYGYDYMQHRAYIRKAIEEGYFHLPKNPQIKRMVCEIRECRKKEDLYLTKHATFCFRWKIRMQKIFTRMIRWIRPNHHGIDPFGIANELAQTRSVNDMFL